MIQFRNQEHILNNLVSSNIIYNKVNKIHID